MASVAIMKAFVMLHILAGFMPVLRGVYLLHCLVDLDGVDLVRLSSHSSHCNLFCMPSHATCVTMSVSYFTCCSVLGHGFTDCMLWKLHLEDAASQQSWFPGLCGCASCIFLYCTVGLANCLLLYLDICKACSATQTKIRNSKKQKTNPHHRYCC